MDGAPYFVASASQLLGLGIQRIVALLGAAQYDGIVNDETEAEYLIPERLNKTALERRWTRDSDALLAALFSASIVGTGLDEFHEISRVVYVLAGVGVLLPVLGLAVILSINPDKYYGATLFKKSFPVSAFAYVAFLIGMATGLVVSFAP